MSYTEMVSESWEVRLLDDLGSEVPRIPRPAVAGGTNLVKKRRPQYLDAKCETWTFSSPLGPSMGAP